MPRSRASCSCDSARLARALDDLLGLGARLLQPLAVFLEHLVGFGAVSAASISPSIVFARLSRASPISGNTHLRRMNNEIENTTIVQTMIPTLGLIRNEPLEASGMFGGGEHFGL